MQIILLQDIDKVGYKHEIAKVKNGYARNFLIPNGMAVIANGQNMKKLDSLKEKAAQEENARLDDYKVMAEKLEGQTLKIAVKAGTSGKIFGSVNNTQVVNAIKETFDMDVERRKVELPEDIKEIGTFPAIINLHEQVKANVNLELIQD